MVQKFKIVMLLLDRECQEKVIQADVTCNLDKLPRSLITVFQQTCFALTSRSSIGQESELSCSFV